jgi:ATPase subunit of ABC transporter with duplicated ATPase domains
MGRDVDERKKRAALRKLRKAAELAEQGKGPPLSDWEREFLEEVEERIEKYGSAFADPMKGDEGEALSALQQLKLKEIDKKARGKARKGFSQKSATGQKTPKGSFAKRASPRVRQIDDDIEEEAMEAPPPAPVPRGKPVLKTVPKDETSDPAPDAYKDHTPASRPAGRPVFRVIDGGKTEPET